jgi:hypothetical protein
VNRSPLAYPLNRAADTDVGGAADLQTDVMRFMAILALCLVAIFALVQSIPLTPVPVTDERDAEPQPQPADIVSAKTVEPVAVPVPPVQQPAKPEVETAIVLTHPTWTPRYAPQEPSTAEVAATIAAAAIIEPAAPTPPQAPVTEAEGFTLRFASDAALMRAVAAHRVGVYAIEPDRARRMTVSESRISFWDASMPNSFHEMESGTVPLAVTTALSGSGIEPATVNWGVTLPGRMKAQLDALMQQHRAGTLIIGPNGDIHWEAPQ